MIKQIWNWKMT